MRHKGAHQLVPEHAVVPVVAVGHHMVLVMMHRPVEPRDDYILPRVVQRRQNGRGQEETDDAGDVKPEGVGDDGDGEQVKVLPDEVLHRVLVDRILDPCANRTHRQDVRTASAWSLLCHGTKSGSLGWRRTVGRDSLLVVVFVDVLVDRAVVERPVEERVEEVVHHEQRRCAKPRPSAKTLSRCSTG